MQIVIDIPEDAYNYIKANGIIVLIVEQRWRRWKNEKTNCSFMRMSVVDRMRNKVQRNRK